MTRTFSGYGETDAESSSVNGTGLFSWSAVRDDNGRITQKTETFGDGTTATYVYDYDTVGRLLTVTKDGAVAESYQYDTRPYGIRTYQEVNDVTKSLSYNDEDNLLTAGGVSYQHDDDGFLVSRTQETDVTTYDYSLRGELLSVTLPDSTVIEYVHGPLGRRIAKKVGGTVTEKYLWQGLTRLLAVYNTDDTLKIRFEYADARMPVAMTKDGVTYYLAYDQVGSLKAVSDSSGNVMLKRECDSFGNILDEEGTPPFEIPFGFAGGLHDSDTGLVRFGHRDYDPGTGRWTAKDPILFAGGDTDLYGYCLNDPVNWNDPSGLELSSGENAAIAIVGAITATVASGIGTPAAGAVAGGFVGFFGTLILGGDIQDAINNLAGGALTGMTGGLYGQLIEVAGWGMGRRILWSGWGYGFDLIVYGCDPVWPKPCP
ncbi:RHS repeat-associated core domain-containing protein [Desulfonema magnum]|uniref:RHS repeat-associated core domain-containing protein n=1 Tax=Desulfonema magnum TaxID=45655 RepID=A0A975BFJ9_9BACT|nr:RHS repeat-associated core domain-containing protein [Desulfonema magnum]QTA84145.1 RHS repeat-associated core domain-containing protein [Desulfonema magnum]